MKHSLREYEAEALRLPRSTRCARVKRSAMLLFRVAKPRFIGQSPASFFMRVSALHFQTKEHCSRSALLFVFRGRKDYQARTFVLGKTQPNSAALQERIRIHDSFGSVLTRKMPLVFFNVFNESNRHTPKCHIEHNSGKDFNKKISSIHRGQPLKQTTLLNRLIHRIENCKCS